MPAADRHASPLLARTVVARSVLAVLAAVLAMLVLVAPRAAAHDVLVDAAPADGETLTETPSQVVLTFSNDLLDSTSAIVVADATGETVAEGSPSIEGPMATLATEPLPDGDYTVTWSVVSGDGHRIEGEYGFTVAAGGSAADPTEEATTPGVADTTATPDQAGPPGDTVSEEEAGGAPLELPTWVAIVVAIAILAGLVATIVRLRRRR